MPLVACIFRLTTGNVKFPRIKSADRKNIGSNQQRKLISVYGFKYFETKNKRLDIKDEPFGERFAANFRKGSGNRSERCAELGNYSADCSWRLLTTVLH